MVLEVSLCDIAELWKTDELLPFVAVVDTMRYHQYGLMVNSLGASLANMY